MPHKKKGCACGCGCEELHDCGATKVATLIVEGMAQPDDTSPYNTPECCENINATFNFGPVNQKTYVDCFRHWYATQECCQESIGSYGQKAEVWFFPNYTHYPFGDFTGTWDVWVTVFVNVGSYVGARSFAYRAIFEDVSASDICTGELEAGVGETVEIEGLEDVACNFSNLHFLFKLEEAPGTTPAAETGCDQILPEDPNWGLGCNCGGLYEHGEFVGGVIYMAGWQGHECELSTISLDNLNGSWSATYTCLGSICGTWNGIAYLGDFESLADPGTLVYERTDGVDVVLRAWVYEIEENNTCSTTKCGIYTAYASLFFPGAPTFRWQWYNYEDERWNHPDDTPSAIASAFIFVETRDSVCEASGCGNGFCDTFTTLYNRDDFEPDEECVGPSGVAGVQAEWDTPGEYEWEIPEGSFGDTLLMEAVGGGNGGQGGGDGTDNGGGGGDGSDYGRTAVTIGITSGFDVGTILKIKVGSGGNGGAVGASPTIPGEASWIKDETETTTLLQAEVSGVVADEGNGGGAGGSAGSTAGGNGGGGGGGGGGYNAVGANGSIASTSSGAAGGQGGWTAPSTIGHGGRGGDDGQPGESGLSYGGGGGGGGSGAAGGAGGNGWVRLTTGTRIEYEITYCSIWPPSFEP